MKRPELLPTALTVGIATAAVISGNGSLMLAEAAILMLASLGALTPASMGNFDVSTTSNAALGGAVTLAVLPHAPVAVAILAGCLASVAAGAAIGALVLLGRLPALLASLSATWLLRGLAFSVSGALEPSEDPWLQEFAWALWPLPPYAIGVVALTLGIAWLLHRTPVGPGLTMLAQSPSAATRRGVSRPGYIIGSFAASGLCAGLVGLVAVARTGTVSVAVATSTELDIFLSIFICGSVLPGRVASIYRLLAGVLFVTALEGALLRLGISARATELLKGSMLVAALVVHYHYLRTTKAREGRIDLDAEGFL